MANRFEHGVGGADSGRYGAGTARVWYPASGCRNYVTGALTNVGYYGYSWSRSVRGTDGFYLDFSATWFNPSTAYYRGHGFSVRCLQE